MANLTSAANGQQRKIFNHENGKRTMCGIIKLIWGNDLLVTPVKVSPEVISIVDESIKEIREVTGYPEVIRNNLGDGQERDYIYDEIMDMGRNLARKGLLNEYTNPLAFYRQWINQVRRTPEVGTIIDEVAFRSRATLEMEIFKVDEEEPVDMKQRFMEHYIKPFTLFAVGGVLFLMSGCWSGTCHKSSSIVMSFLGLGAMGAAYLWYEYLSRKLNPLTVDERMEERENFGKFGYRGYYDRDDYYDDDWR